MIWELVIWFVSDLKVELALCKRIPSACQLYKVHNADPMSLFSVSSISWKHLTSFMFLGNTSFFKNVFYNFLLVFTHLPVVSLISVYVSEIYLFMMENILLL